MNCVGGDLHLAEANLIPALREKPYLEKTEGVCP
ncbi:hypothetical protein HNQ10_000206 [Deinococcus metallilatus]|uniref:Uncharacterized protein n=1 Tax=Deinococcus metallilatus TaxID=1211322 RepID=A0ABR6MN78_9DEIO|nr:hypothetical protein [Deinococcus metallilatus]